jgi:ubiquinone/menaquinone biosynthesis C-methylase UbiE
MSRIEQYYDEHTLNEWERVGVRHRTEFAVSMRAFADHLPKPPASVLDIGGGPGRYSIALAQQGYTVTLLDLSRANLDFARERACEAGVQLVDTLHGNALDLSAFPDASFDVVLLMGPLYHLIAEADRHTALREAGRVLKLGGVIACAFLMRYATAREAARSNPAMLVEQQDVIRRVLDEGVLEMEGNFTTAYLVHPTDVKPLCESHGFETLALVAAEGIISLIGEKVNETEGELWDAWVQLNYRLGHDPSVHGATEHLLYVGRKSQ